MQNVLNLGECLKSKIDVLAQANPNIIEGVRGKGLMLGIKCKANNMELCAALRDEGLLTVVAAENILRLLPPLNIELEHIDTFFNIFDKTLSKMVNS